MAVVLAEKDVVEDVMPRAICLLEILHQKLGNAWRETYLGLGLFEVIIAEVAELFLCMISWQSFSTYQQ